MCGIAGWVGRPLGPEAESVLAAMTGTIRHRGPDDDGHLVIPAAGERVEAALGFRRLAIIDLAGGRQPMRTPDGRLSLVFNGEIYNYRELRAELTALGHEFTSQSDTEVLLHAYRHWGPDAFVRLNGMFATAIWDHDRAELCLARDRFGKKPLYIAEAGGRLVFGSEIKALLAVPGMAQGLDRASVRDYLRYRYVPGPATLFAGIAKLAPGAFGLWRGKEFRQTVWYRPPDGQAAPESDTGLADEAAVDEFVAHLDRAVARRMVSDVPFGAFLSGGIDSSAVVALMRRHSGQPVKTFSVGFREARYSELPAARQVAMACQTDHHELLVDADRLMDDLPKLIRFRDAPVAEPSDIPIYLLAAEARKSVKMVLTGEGSDEVLAGYPKHRAEQWVAAYQRLVPAAVHGGMVAPLIGALPYGFRRAKTVAGTLGLRDPAERLPRWFGALTRADRDRLSALEAPDRPLDRAPFEAAPGTSPLRRVLAFDQLSWLPDNLLERGDRMTMAASVEARMPFLDPDLVAYVAGLPDRFRLRGRTDKWLLRRAMGRVLPAAIVARPKVGFRVPVNEWFRGPMKDYVLDHLTGPESRTRAFYHAPELRRLLAAHLSGRQNHEKLIWALLTLELFQREYALD